MSEKYVIQQGDCLYTIAEGRGFLWQTIWDHGENADLKAQRQDPNILKEGDVLFIPDLVVRQEPRGTDQKHSFVRKGTPAVLRLHLLTDEYETQPQAAQAPVQPGRNVVEQDPVPAPITKKEVPRANVPFTLNIDGTLINGTTDGNGDIKQPIPPNARQGTLTLEPGTLKETVIPLELGGLNPLSEISGVKHRLSNLGFACGDETDESTPDFEEALRVFQQRNDLPVTGQVDGATKSKLQELHGS